MIAYVIEKGIPIPPPFRARAGWKKGSGVRCALRKMEIDDSMVVKPVDQFSISSHASRLGISVVCRNIDGVVRVWRTK